MGIRRKGRELALQALYQIEITGDSSAAAVDLFLSHFEGSAQAKEFARRLVSGVVSQRPDLDRVIEDCTENWKLARMAKVDLLILRMAAYELMFCPDIPLNVSLDEAIEPDIKRARSAGEGTFTGRGAAEAGVGSALALLFLLFLNRVAVIDAFGD